MKTRGNQSQSKTKSDQGPKLIGHTTDATIKGIVEKFPGLSLYEIQKLANSSLGLVDGSIRRLEKNGVVRVRRVLRGGRSTKEVFPFTYSETDNSEVKLDKEVFPNPDVWKDTVHLYALNRSSIGVSPVIEQEWESKALFKAHVGIKKDERSIIFDIPPNFKDFYLWENSKLDISVIDELVLLNLSTVIPIAKSNFESETKYSLSSSTQ
jgi:hypothetical protein